MALTQEQEDALITLLDKASITLNKLPEVEQTKTSDLFLIQQNLEEKTITLKDFEDYFLPFLDDMLNDEYLVGTPIPWPTLQVPEGYLKCNGAAFDKEKYPRLADIYPTGILPDLRGEFIRGFDDGRGVDKNNETWEGDRFRDILSSQEDTLQELFGQIEARTIGNIEQKGIFSGREGYGGIYFQNYTGKEIYKTLFFSGLVARVSKETRPRNISFLYIVRAA